MPTSDDAGEFLRLRDLARRARRLADHFLDDDRARLLAHADDLERTAAELERRIADTPGVPPTDPPRRS